MSRKSAEVVCCVVEGLDCTCVLWDVVHCPVLVTVGDSFGPEEVTCSSHVGDDVGPEM